MKIRQELFSRPEWANLIIHVQDFHRALGFVTHGWLLTERYWLRHKGVPIDLWPKDLSVLVMVGLAVEVSQESHRIVMLGAETQMKSLEQRAKAGSIKKKQPRKKSRVRTTNRSLTVVNETKRNETKLMKVPISTQFAITESWSVQLPNELLRLWSETYPEEFLRGELKKIRIWLVSNQHKAPKTQWGKFFSGWFERGWEKERKILSSNKVQANKLTIEDIEKLWEADK